MKSFVPLICTSVILLLSNEAFSQTPPAVIEQKQSQEALVVDLLKEIHNKGAEHYNVGQMSRCLGMYEAGLSMAKGMLSKHPDVVKMIDDGMDEAKKDISDKIQAFKLHELIEKVRSELRKKDEANTEKPKDPKEPEPKKEPNPPMPPKVSNVPAAGTITLDGKPLAAEITLVSLTLAKPRVFTLTSSADGKLEIPKSVPEGTYAVMISDKSVAEKYKSVQSSGLEIVVKAAGTFELKLQK